MYIQKLLSGLYAEMEPQNGIQFSTIICCKHFRQKWWHPQLWWHLC